MKKTYNQAKPQRLFRRLVSHLFSGLIKYQECNYQVDVEKIVGMLQGIEDSIEIMAREMARQARRGK